ncbi:hypothetical protein PG997_010978 [Apiospora hydei]|uniref:NACHT domain-containing protein n=1 Tax=Apiospora hydei TaxID=1337664 RepID=A0ABR1VKL8_9PEZI
MAECALLGLVANIFQFVETGVKIALTAKDVYQCVDNLQTKEIRLLLDDIKQTGADVSKLPQGTLSEDELAICEYSDECNAIASELDALAAKFARRDGAKSRTLDSVRISWHSHTKKNEVRDLVTRLNRIDERLRTRFEKVLHRQAGLENEDRWSSVMLAIESLDLKTENMNSTQDNLLESAAHTLKGQLRTEKYVAELVKLFLGEIRSMQYYQNQLESLLFQDIKQRYSDINPAHKVTFKWAFDHTSTQFPQWLESGDGYFWIHGLAGSGKSTLMKYLKETASNGELLLLGPRDVDAKVATGSPTKPPFPAGDHTRFCFFIDGLDEYEGNETDIISTIAELLASPNIKICLSSRPWNRFREAYANCPGLTLDSLTNKDISDYIRYELLSNRSFQRSVDEDPRCHWIITQISSQARGVFLWVFLVVRSLLRDIQSQEPFEHLQRRVTELPPSLDEYFRRIFDRIDAIYRQQTARLFLVALYLEEHDEDPLPLMAYNCLEAEVRNPFYAANQRLLARNPEWIRHLPEYIAESQRIAIIRLDDRCKDLLQPRRNEAFHPASVHHFHISLLHRTVRDFFRDNYHRSLREKAGGDFSPEGSISKCILWLFKTYPIKLFFSPTAKPVDDLPEEVKVLVQRYRQPEEYKMSLVLYWFWSHVMRHEDLINDQVIESFFDTMVTLCEQTWPQRIVPHRLTRYLSPYPAGLMLTPWAAFLNLHGYLRRNWKPGKAEGGYFDYEVLTLLLALEPRCLQAVPPSPSGAPSAGSRHNYMDIRAGAAEEQPTGSVTATAKILPVPMSPSTVRTLMELGCDPRDQKLGLAFLDRFYKARWDNKTIVGLTEVGGKADVYGSNQNVFEVAKVLFEHGLSVPLGPDEEISLCKANFGSVFRPIFGVDGVAELAEIRRRHQGQLPKRKTRMALLPIISPLFHPLPPSQHSTSKERVVHDKSQEEATPSRTDAPNSRFRGCLCLPSVAVLSGTVVVLVGTPCLASLASLDCTSSLTGLNSTAVVLRGPSALTVLAGSVVVLGGPSLPILSGAIVRVEPVVVVLGSASSLAPWVAPPACPFGAAPPLFWAAPPWPAGLAPPLFWVTPLWLDRMSVSRWDLRQVGLLARLNGDGRSGSREGKDLDELHVGGYVYKS